MAKQASVRVSITADNSDLRRGTVQAERDLGRLEKTGSQSLHRLKGAAVLATGALGVGLTKGLFYSIKVANEAETSQAKLQAQLKASGISYRDHGKEIDKVIQKTADLAAVDDEDLQDAFTNIIRATGNVKQSMKLVGLAADIARAKHIDLAKAGDIVGKVSQGNTGILSRYGITVKKGSTATEALGLLQQKFSGQAQKYGKTTQGALDRARNAVENLGEQVGSALAPTLEKVANATAKFIDGFRKGTGAGGAFRDRLQEIWDKAKPIIGFFKDHPKLIGIAIGAWAAYKAASLLAIGVINVRRFRSAFFKSVPAGAEAGTAAGAAYGTSFNTASATGIGKGRKGFRTVGTSLGKTIGIAAGAAAALEIGAAIDKTIRNAVKSHGGKTHDGHIGSFSIPTNIDAAGLFLPKAKQKVAGKGGAGLSNPGSGLGGLPAKSNPIKAPNGGRPKAGTARASGASARAARSAGRGVTARTAASSSAIVPLGRWLQSQGFNVAEHPAFGGVHPVHVNGSLHYSGQALDVNHDQGGEDAALTALAGQLQAAGWHVLWHVTGHYDHLHVDTLNGVGRIPGGGSSGGSGSVAYSGASGGSGGASFVGAPRVPKPKPKPDRASTVGVSYGSQVPVRRKMLASAFHGTGQDIYDAEAAAADIQELQGQPEMAAFTRGVSLGKQLDVVNQRLLSGRLKPKRRAELLRRKAELLAAIKANDESYAASQAKPETDAGTGEDPNQALIDALNANADAVQAQAAQVADLRSTVAADTALRERIFGTQTGVVMAAIADMVSGNIGGRVGLGVQTPGFAGGGIRY